MYTKFQVIEVWETLFEHWERRIFVSVHEDDKDWVKCVSPHWQQKFLHGMNLHETVMVRTYFQHREVIG